MTLLDRPARNGSSRHEPTRTGRDTIGRDKTRRDSTGLGRLSPGDRGRPEVRRLGTPRTGATRSLLIALVLACATLATLDSQGAESSPLDPARRVVGEVFGPLETGAAAVVGPIAGLPDWVRSQDSLRRQVDDLEADNASLRGAVASVDLDRSRLTEYDGLTSTAKTAGYALVPSRVAAIGPAQSFSRTVTIDAGSRAGIAPDMTVVNNDGLVGRVLRVNRSSATVLLIIDGDSVVGGRLGNSLEAGFLRGRGVIGNDGRLDLELVDQTVVPAKGDVVASWGSEAGAPYVSDIPVGRVDSVFSNVRESTQRAVIEPFVDFSALDLVGVVVPSGSRSDRAVIEADGTIRR